VTNTLTSAAGVALGVFLYAIAVFAGFAETTLGEKSRTNALSMNGLHLNGLGLNGLHLNGADLRALTGDNGTLHAPAGRLTPASE
jgi:hypothetical protein